MSSTSLNLLATGASTLTTTCLINTLSKASPRKYNTHTVSLSALATTPNAAAADAIFSETRFDAIYLVLQHRDCTTAVKHFLDAAKHHRVPFVIFVSVIGAEDLPAELASRYIDIQLHLDAIGMKHTVLRVAPLQQDFMFLCPDFVQQSIPTIELPFSNGSVAPIHARDVADVAAAILEKPSVHMGKSYTLTGPDSLTGVELAGRAAVGLDRPVGFRNCQPAEARNHLRVLARANRSSSSSKAVSTASSTTSTPAPLDSDAVEAALRLFNQVAAHNCERVTTTVHTLTRRPATHIEVFFKEHRELFNAAASEPQNGSSSSSSSSSFAAAAADEDDERNTLSSSSSSSRRTRRDRADGGLEFVSNAYLGSGGNGLGRYIIRSKL
ncbi:hypothetical protein HDU86_001092 [Geranomyces michiganensis]|nr:hypothetical protein HDU86_001092 [Geranomyces michiganensis]